MRQTILAAAAAFVIGGAATGAVLSQAQPAPPPAPPTDMAPAAPEMRMMHFMHERMGQRPFNPRDFALVYPQADRQLTPADVQKIAEAFLLWNGNHTWKVGNVGARPDGAIGFSLMIDNAVVATFAMDPHTGHVTRIS